MFNINRGKDESPEQGTFVMNIHDLGCLISISAVDTFEFYEESAWSFDFQHLYFL